MIDSNKELNYRESNTSEKYYIADFYGNYFSKRGTKYLVASLLIVGLSLYGLFSYLSLGLDAQYILLHCFTGIPYYLLGFILFLIYRKHKKIEANLHEGNYLVADVQYVNIITRYNKLEKVSYLQYRVSNQEPSIFDKSAEISMRALKDRNYDKSLISPDTKAQVIKLPKVSRLFGVVYL